MPYLFCFLKNKLFQSIINNRLKKIEETINYILEKIPVVILDTMKEYAGRVLKIETVSINAMPAWSSSYFKRNGFWILGNIDVQHASFVPMMANSSCYVKEKETDDSVLVGIICLIAFFIYCITAM